MRNTPRSNRVQGIRRDKPAWDWEWAKQRGTKGNGVKRGNGVTPTLLTFLRRKVTPIVVPNGSDRRKLLAPQKIGHRTHLRVGMSRNMPRNPAFAGFQSVDNADSSAQSSSSRRGWPPAGHAGSQVSGGLHLETEEPFIWVARPGKNFHRGARFDITPNSTQRPTRRRPPTLRGSVQRRFIPHRCATRDKTLFVSHQPYTACP